MEKEFDELVERFKELSTKDKKDAVIKQLKNDIAVAHKINSDIGNNHDLFLNREVLDLNDEESTMDDFLEAVFVYVNTLNDQYMSFAEKIANEFYE